MGSVYNRGSRDKPLWYGQYKDLDGKLKKVPTGQPSKGAALLFVAEREREVAERLRARAAGLPDPPPPLPARHKAPGLGTGQARRIRPRSWG